MQTDSFTKEECGVVIRKGDKYWGLLYSDHGHGGGGDSYGFGSLETASVHNPKFLKRPEDAVYVGSSQTESLRGSDLVPVVKTTVVTFELNPLPKAANGE